MLMKIRLLTTGVLMALLLVSPVWASKRVALVIGNSKYEHASRLANPVNDANDIGAALGRLGFSVSRLVDVGESQMKRGLQEFRAVAAGADLAVIFYAGHGIEVDNENFLIPIDARLGTDKDIEFETVSLDLVQRTLADVRGLGIVILDACRNNPFATAMKKSGGSRSVGRGLARVGPSSDSQLIAYAAKEGKVAADGDVTERNSPYTTALLSYLEEPGLEVGLMFRKVGGAVKAATNDAQVPVVYGSLPDEKIYLAGLPNPPDPPPDPEEPKRPTEPITDDLSRLSAARNAYVEAGKVGSKGAFEAVIEDFPNSFYAKLAREQIGKLTQPEPTQPEPTPPEPPKVDSQAVETALNLAREDRRLVQLALDAAGHKLGSIDGVLGKRSRAALEQWQAQQGEPATGYLTETQWAALRQKGLVAKEEVEKRNAERAEREGASRGKALLDEHGGDEAMWQAANKGDVAAMRWLKAQGISVNPQDQNSWGTPMHSAAKGGHVAAMRWLKAQGASVNLTGPTGRTPMHSAAWNGQVAAMRWLKAQGVSVNVRVRDSRGQTPMHYAAVRGHVAAMRWLKAQGVSVNVRDNKGKTPMYFAERRGKDAAVNWLRANGGGK